jgi:CelD/BcsL family acetyltransferase involved in cellulose biosynthesis
VALKVEMVDPGADARWAGLEHAEGASLYHSAPWMRLIAATYGFRSRCYLGLHDTRAVAALPFFEVGAPWWRRRLISLPFSDTGGPIGDPAAIPVLLETVLRDASAEGWMVEVRGGVDTGTESSFTVTTHNDLHCLAIDRPLADIVRGFSDSVRWGRKRALKEGVTVERSSAIGELREFYRLHQLTRRKLGVPVQPWRFFACLWREFFARDAGFVVRACHGGRAIASAVFLRHGACLYYKFSASDPRSLALQPNSLLLWEAVEWAHRAGLAKIDLGKTVRENVGLARFKRSWGASADPLPHFYFPRVAGVGAEAEDSRRVRLARAVWRCLPLPVARVVGGLLYRALA